MQPDSLSWSQGAGPSQTVASMEVTATLITGRFQLSTTTDTIYLSLWTAGMRSAVVPFVQTGSDPILTSKNPVVDPIAKELLKNLPEKIQRTHDTIIAFYASHLVDNDPAFAGFPGNTPTGIDTAEVIRAALIYAASKQAPFSALSKIWLLGVDTTTLHARVKSLVESGKIPASDTINLFPPYPVRVKTPISIGSIQLGLSLPVTGAFVGDSSLTKIGWRVLQGTVDRSGGFRPSFSAQVDGSQHSWDLQKDASYSLSAISASLGTYTLLIWMADAQNRSDTSRVSFQVIAPIDTIGPTLKWVAPTSSQVLEFSDSVLAVKIIATDPAGIGIVTVNDTSASGTDSTFTRSVIVPVSDKGMLLTVKATDKLGNHTTDSVQVLRKAASGDPRIRLISPANDSTVPFETATVRFEWSVVAPVGKIDSVIIQGGLATQEKDSLYFRDIAIDPTGKPSIVGIKVYTRGLAFLGEAQVTRLSDTKGPSIQWVAPAISISVDAAVSSAKVRVKALDFAGVDSVTLQNVKATNDSGGYWSASVPLDGANGQPLNLVAKAWDKNRNLSVDSSISITRNVPDGTDKPTLKLLQPTSATGNSIPFDSTTIHVVYSVTDLLDLDTTSIKFNTTTAKRIAGSNWGADVSVPATGVAFIITVQASNIIGNGTVDQILVTRAKDTVRPTAIPVSGSRTVAFDSTKVVVSWKVTDNDSLGSVKIAGTDATNSNQTFSSTMSLAVGTNKFGVLATDRTGNSITDTIVITRTKDMTPPTVSRGTGTSTRPVPYDTTLATLDWTLSDNDSIASISWNKILQPVTAAVTKSVNLAVGTNSFVLVVTDKTGNVTKDSIALVRAAPIPVHSARSGNYIGTVYDTIVSAGADSIQISTDGANWRHYSGVATADIIGTTTLHARAWPGNALSSITLNISQIKSIAVGGIHTLFIKYDGTAWATGSNSYGQLGDWTSVSSKTPVQVKGMTGVTAVAAGYTHSLFLKDNGTLWATGSNSNGQLGDSTFIDRNMPVQVKGPTNIQAIAAGDYHSLFTTTGGALWAMGLNSTGQIGDGTNIDREAPVAIRNRSGVTSIAGGGRTSMFLMADRSLWVNGSGGYGQLGLGSSDEQDISVPVTALPEVNSIAAGQTRHLALKLDGTVWAMGSNGYGELGIGGGLDQSIPVQIPNLSDIQAIASGPYSGYFLKKDGTVWAAGLNNQGQLGDGTMVNRSSPIQVQGVSNVRSIAAGGSACFFLEADGTLWATGQNSLGQLGDGTAVSKTVPTRINF
jgi:alpha-tubulin suppressor-like RCC1 family protein